MSSVSASAFVSYSRNDRDYVDRLAAYLATQGVPVWYDHEIELGDQFTRRIQNQIDQSIAVIVVMSHAAVASQWVEREIFYAMGRNRPILALRVEPSDHLLLANLDHEDVFGGQLPSERFIMQLRRLVGTTPEQPLLSMSARLRHTLPGKGARCLAVTRDGSKLAVAVGTSAVKVYATATWQPQYTLRHGIGPPVFVVAFSPLDDQVATGGATTRGGMVWTWNATTGRAWRRLPHSSPVHALAFDADGAWLASGCTDGRVSVWSATDSRRLLEFTHLQRVYGVAFGANRDRLVSISQDGPMRIWSTYHRTEVGLTTLDSGGFALAVSQDGALIAAAGSPIGLWQALDGMRLATFHSLQGNAPCFSLAFSPDGRVLSSGHSDGSIALWDVQRRTELLRVASQGNVRALTFSPDGRWLASGHEPGGVRVWDLSYVDS
jgi:WD40 repeat protein